MTRKKAEIIPIINKWENAHKLLKGLSDIGDGTGYVLITVEHYTSKKPKCSFTTNYYTDCPLAIRREAASALRLIALKIEESGIDDPD